MYEKRDGRSERDPFDALIDVLTAASRDDPEQAVVPAAFAVALVVATMASVSVVEAMLVAAIGGVLVIIDGYYRNPSIDQRST